MRPLAMFLCACAVLLTVLDVAAKQASGPFDKYFSRQCPDQATDLEADGAIHPEAVRELTDIPKFVVEAAKSELGRKIEQRQGEIKPDSTIVIDKVWEIAIGKKEKLLFANVSYSWDKDDLHGRYRLAIAVNPRTGMHVVVKTFSACYWGGKEDYCPGEGEYSQFCVPYDLVDIKGTGEKAVILYEGEKGDQGRMVLLNIAAYRAQASGWVQLGVGCTSQWD